MRVVLAVIACLLVSAACSSPAPKCDATSCPGCCTATGACVGGTEFQACGKGGVACADCSLQHSVCINQVCVLAPDGGGPGGGAGGGTGGGGGGSSVDAGGRYPDGGSMYRYWDGGTCTVKTDCPCFSSDDCGPGFTCVSEDSTGANVWCKPGARGDGGVGATCTGEGDCQSALCVTGASSASFCSALCSVAAECPVSLPRCTYVGFGVDRSICSP